MHTIKLHLSILTQQQISDSSQIPLEGKITLVELQEDQSPDATLSLSRQFAAKIQSLDPA